MKVINHKLVAVEQLNSPNFNERPENCPVDMVVVHNIALPPGEFGGPYIAQLFLNQLDINAHPHFRVLAGLKVASHVVIYRDGSVQQFVSFDKRAWHAGVSSYQGRNECNDFSIGIELEGSENVPYPDIQYQKLAIIIHSLMQSYPHISRNRIVGHRDISPGRKTDPGLNFDWPKLRALLKQQG